MGRSLVYQDFLAIKVLTSSLMFIYSKFENISLYLNNFLIFFVTESTDSSILIPLPCIFSNKSLPAYERKENLAHYLAGLIEGDGAIIVPKTIRNQKGKLLYPVVKITFVEKDAPLAKKIKEKNLFEKKRKKVFFLID